jgi:hypothetical protein
MYGTAARGALRSLVLVATVALGGMAGPAIGQGLDPAALVGTWRGYELTGGYQIGSEVIFFPNGGYQRISALGQLMTLQTGNWSVVQTWIHFSPTDWEPKEYEGRRLSPPPSETWQVDHFDGMSIHATIGGMSEVSFQRVQ